MTLKANQIKLGDVHINTYQLCDGYYAAPGLFRLAYTNVYRYGDYWYWLCSNSLPDITNCKFQSSGRDVFLAFQGNKLCHLYVNPVDRERDLYVPITNNIRAVIKFCILGELATDRALGKLSKALGRLSSFGDPALLRAGLLKDTFSRLSSANVRALGFTKGKSPRTPKSRKSKASQEKIGVIYLVKLDAHLKIGFTKDINKRLKSFQTTNVRVELVKSIDGTLCQEKTLHSLLGSKVRELYDFKDEWRIIEAMNFA
jgi:hypothetical protein